MCLHNVVPSVENSHESDIVSERIRRFEATFFMPLQLGSYLHQWKIDVLMLSPA